MRDGHSNPSGSRFPRVLIVGAGVMGAPTGMGITLENLFQLWPSDRVAQVHTSPPFDTRQPLQTFHYGEDQVRGAGVIRSLFDRSGGSAPRHLSAESGWPARTPPRSGWKSAWMDQLPLRRPHALAEFVESFQPDVVYSPLGSARVARLAVMCAGIAGAPIVPHFMDEWLHQLTQGAAASIPRRTMQRRIESIVRSSPRGLAISDEMAVEYSRRYNVHFDRLSNFIDIGPLVAVPDAACSSIGYVGGLHLDRWTSLLDVARQIEVCPRDVELHAYVPAGDLAEFGHHFEGLGRTSFRPPVTASAVPQLLQQFHALVHVEAVTPAARAYVRFSLSTKIPQYLASGRPVVAYGPQEVASMSHLKRSGAAINVESGDVAALDDALRVVADDRQRCLSMGTAGRHFASSHHERVSQTEVFRSALSAASARR